MSSTNWLPRSFHLPDISAQHAAVVAGALYILGFVVANAHYASFQVTRMDLLETRYLSASLLFVFAVVFPFFIGYRVGRLFPAMGFGRPVAGDEQPLKEFFSPREARIAFAKISLSGLIAYLISALAVSVRLILVVEALVAYLVVFTFGALSYRYLLAGYVLWSRAPFTGLIRGSIVVSIASAAAIGSPFIFGQRGYGEIAPSFGGGAAWLGRLGFVADAEKDLANQAAPTAMPTTIENGAADILAEVRSSNVILIDRDPNETTFLICNRTRHRAVPVTVPTSSIRWLNTITVVSTGQADLVLCGHPTSKR